MTFWLEASCYIPMDALRGCTKLGAWHMSHTGLLDALSSFTLCRRVLALWDDKCLVPGLMPDQPLLEGRRVWMSVEINLASSDGEILGTLNSTGEWRCNFCG